MAGEFLAGDFTTGDFTTGEMKSKVYMKTPYTTSTLILIRDRLSSSPVRPLNSILSPLLFSSPAKLQQNSNLKSTISISSLTSFLIMRYFLSKNPYQYIIHRKATVPPQLWFSCRGLLLFSFTETTFSKSSVRHPVYNDKASTWKNITKPHLSTVS